MICHFQHARCGLDHQDRTRPQNYCAHEECRSTPNRTVSLDHQPCEPEGKRDIGNTSYGRNQNQDALQPPHLKPFPDRRWSWWNWCQVWWMGVTTLCHVALSCGGAESIDAVRKVGIVA